MKRAILACTFLLLAGCATPYQPCGFAGGYSDTQLAPDGFRVFFRGNGYTSRERTQDFAMLRAAELTIEGGFKHFAILDESSSEEVSTFTTPGSSQTTGSAYVYGGSRSYYGTYSGHTTYYPPQTYFIFKPHSEFLIKCFPEKPEAIYTFDALFLQNSLKQKYKIEQLNSGSRRGLAKGRMQWRSQFYV